MHAGGKEADWKRWELVHGSDIIGRAIPVDFHSTPECLRMIPAFDEYGNLPPGVHVATLEEITDRFGAGSAEREAQELKEFVRWARLANIRRMVVNGSFVTALDSPNDVDVVILPADGDELDEANLDELQGRFPYVQIIVALNAADLERWALIDFGTDRRLLPKGVIEVLL